MIEIRNPNRENVSEKQRSRESHWKTISERKRRREMETEYLSSPFI